MSRAAERLIMISGDASYFLETALLNQSDPAQQLRAYLRLQLLETLFTRSLSRTSLITT